MSGSVKNMSKWLRSSGYHVLNFIAINLQLHKIFKIKWVRFLGHSVNYSGHISYRFCATVDLMPKWPRWATVTSKWQWRSIHITSEMKSPWDWAKNYLWQRFRVNPCIIFCVSLQTDRQTDKPSWSHNLRPGGGNNTWQVSVYLCVISCTLSPASSHFRHHNDSLLRHTTLDSQEFIIRINTDHVTKKLMDHHRPRRFAKRLRQLQLVIWWHNDRLSLSITQAGRLLGVNTLLTL